MDFETQNKYREYGENFFFALLAMEVSWIGGVNSLSSVVGDRIEALEKIREG